MALCCFEKLNGHQQLIDVKLSTLKLYRKSVYLQHLNTIMTTLGGVVRVVSLEWCYYDGLYNRVICSKDHYETLFVNSFPSDVL